MKRLYLAACWAACSLLAVPSDAQSYFEQSSTPESTAIIQQAETYLDHSSGVVNISLPLHVVSAGNISIPISLGYHASGIKLNDQASSVGLGWNLSYGGKITRVVKGDNDLFSGNYSNGLRYRDGIALRNYIWGNKESKYESYNQADSEPDLFYYELPGKSGMFVLDHIGRSVQIPYQNVSINYVPYLGYFTILDYETGTVYTFGSNYDSREYTQATFPNENIKKDEEQTIRYASTWYISSIETFQGETVTFKYKAGPGYGYTETNQETHFKSNINNGKLDLGSLNHSSSIKQKDSYFYYESPKYIEEIETENQIVYFESSGTLKLRYDAVRVKYKSHYEPMPVVQLHYGSFNNGRLKLEKITRDNSKTDELLYRLHYNPNNELPGITDPGYKKDYDHWGYYNRANNEHYRTRIQLSYNHWKDILDEDETVIPPSFAGRPITSDSGSAWDYQFPYCPNCNEAHSNTLVFPGARREPHILGTMANVLQKVEYGTGGYVSFGYDGNTARTGPGSGDYRTVGGLRTRSITTSDGVNSSTVNYKYVTDRNDVFSTSGIQSKNICDDYYYTVSRGDKSFPGGVLQNLNFRIYQRPIYNIGDAIGNNVTYSTVFEEYPDGSYIKYDYTSSLDPNCFDINTIYVVKNSSGTVVEREYRSHDDLLPKTSVHWRRGLLKSVEQYDSEGNMVSKQRNQYRFEEMGLETTGYIMSPRGEKELFGYKWISEAVLLDSVITEKGPYNTRSRQKHEYDPVYKVPVKTTYTDDELNRIEIITTYAHQYSPANTQAGGMAEACSLLTRKGMIAPVEKIIVKNGNVVGGEITLYRKALLGRVDYRYHYNPVPYETYKLALDNPVPLNNFNRSYFNGANFVMDQRYIKEQGFESLDNQGNPLTVTDTYNNEGAFIYGQDGNVIAKILNARNDAPEYILSESNTVFPFGGIGMGASFIVTHRQWVNIDIIYDPYIGYDATTHVIVKKVNESVPALSAAITLEEPTRFSLSLEEGRYNITIDRNSDQGSGRVEINMNTLTVSSMNNSRQVYHTSFEDVDGASVNTKAKTGNKVWSGVYQIPLINFAPGSYVLTYWQSTNAGTTWTKQTANVNITAGMTSYAVGSAGALIDEIRLLPPDAVITTYTYNPGVGKTSEMDHNGRVTYWEYDETGRLLKLLDNDRNLIKYYDYNIANN